MPSARMIAPLLSVRSRLSDTPSSRTSREPVNGIGVAPVPRDDESEISKVSAAADLPASGIVVREWESCILPAPETMSVAPDTPGDLIRRGADQAKCRSRWRL